MDSLCLCAHSSIADNLRTTCTCKSTFRYAQFVRVFVLLFSRIVKLEPAHKKQQTTLFVCNKKEMTLFQQHKSLQFRGDETAV